MNSKQRNRLAPYLKKKKAEKYQNHAVGVFRSGIIRKPKWQTRHQIPPCRSHPFYSHLTPQRNFNNEFHQIATSKHLEITC